MRFTIQLVPFLKQRNKPKKLNESLSVSQEEVVFLDFQFCAFMIRQKHDIGPENEVNWCTWREKCMWIGTDRKKTDVTDYVKNVILSILTKNPFHSTIYQKFKGEQIKTKWYKI